MFEDKIAAANKILRKVELVAPRYKAYKMQEMT
jgi:hypothetical protein